MDRLVLIRSFAAVFESGGFASAARTRGVAQSVISKNVAALERDLGCALFQRSTRRVVPTEEAQSLYSRCMPLIEELEDAFADARQQTRGLSGVLRVAAPATFGRLFLAPTLAKFRDRFPSLELEVVTSDGRTDLLAEGIDVALRVGGEDSPAEVVKCLAHSRIKLVGAPKYFDTFGTPSHPSSLIQHDCLVYTKGSNPDQWRFAGPDGSFEIHVRGRLRADNVDIIRSAVLQGAGIAGMTHISIVDELAAGELVSILDSYIPWSLEIKAVWVKRRFVPQKVREFVNFLSEQLSSTLGADMAGDSPLTDWRAPPNRR